MKQKTKPSKIFALIFLSGIITFVLAQKVDSIKPAISETINKPDSVTVKSDTIIKTLPLIDTIKKPDSTKLNVSNNTQDTTVSDTTKTVNNNLTDSTPKIDTSTITDKVELKEEENIEIQNNSSAKYRSPKKALFYSLLVPGLGQLYANSKIKASVFFGAEVALFTSRYLFIKKGDDAYKDFTTFCDNNFSDTLFRKWYDLALPDGAVDTSKDSELNAYLNKTLDDQQRYEQITKNEVYVQGWKDVNPNLNQIQTDNLPDSINGKPLSKDTISSYIFLLDTVQTYGQSALQSEAVFKKSNSNNQYKYADRVWFGILLNHICSAIDAAITAEAYNRSLLNKNSTALNNIHIKSGWLDGQYGMIPTANIVYNF